MNERIKQLVEQAGIHFHNGGTLDAGPNGIAKFVLYSDMEKFAQLIVRECISYIDSRDYHSDSEGIAEHFGVEE
jgi:hypothetical protein